MAEEKGPFLETLLKDALYGTADAPRILGKQRRAAASRCCRASCELDADLIARALAARLEARGVRIDSVEARLRKLAEIHGRPAELPMAQRTPVLLLRLPAQQLRRRRPRARSWAAGIGCHTMVLLNPEGKGEITGITQMGGEGAQWIGMAPFTDDTPPVPEPRRRHLPPLRLARGPRRRRGRREHHLQAALQRARRHDRRPGRSRAS